MYRTLSRIGGVDITPQILRQAWNAEGTRLALKSWAAFGGSHLLLSTDPIRSTLVDVCGSEETYRMGYSALQATILGTVGYKWWYMTAAQRGPILIDRYRRMSGFKLTSALLRVFGTLFISESFLTAIKNPLGMNSYFETINPADKRELHRKWQPYGLQRVTRHSQFLGYSLYALGMMMMARRGMCDLILWGMVPIFSIIGAKHQEYRRRPGTPELYWKESSFWPYGAYLNGMQQGSRTTTEIPPSAYSAAFCMFGAIYFFL